MGTLFKLVFGFAGGPIGWITTIGGWIASAFAWCVAHWKLVLSVLALVAAAAYGASWDHKRMEGKVAVAEHALAEKLAEEKAIADDHQREVADLHGAIQAINKEAAEDKTARQKAYGALQKRLTDYAKAHEGEVPAGDVCRAVDIGADGVRLINDAIAARILRGGGSNAGGTPALPGAGGTEKQ